MTISEISVVGCGPRGLSIVEAVAQAGLSVLAVSVTARGVEQARHRLDRKLSLRLASLELDQASVDAIRRRIRFTRDLGEVVGSDLVIESAVGDAMARRALLATIEGRVSAGAVLASNATRAELPKLAEVLVRRDQFLGLRFFHPATHTSLIEVIALPETAPGALVACQTFCRWLAKTPVDEAEGEVSVLDHPPLASAAG